MTDSQGLPVDTTIALRAVDGDSLVTDMATYDDDDAYLVPPSTHNHQHQRRSSLFDEDDDTSIHQVKVTPPTATNDAVTHNVSSNVAENVTVVITKWHLITMFLLTFVNLLNYMDRYSVAGVLMEIQDFYKINNAEAGLLSTVFIISYMLLSPLFGYLGDRYRRTLIMPCGIFFWSGITLASSFIPKEYFGLFITMRALVGVGEASYSTIAPTLIADLFAGTARTKALCVFFFAIPAGSGLGYISGAKMAEALHGWQWALRLTPALGFASSLLLFIFVKEPVRGGADHGSGLPATSWIKDISYLVCHKSFMFTSFGCTCVAFVAGALALWAPEYVYKSMLLIPGDHPQTTSISLYFGLITCCAGLVGVSLGTFSASKLRSITARADPLVCAFGLLSSAPFLYFSLISSRFSPNATWVLIFFGETLLCLNWAVVQDILLYVVIPTRRSTAEALQILMQHLLGDAGSPFLVGVISDAVGRSYGRHDYVADYLGMQSALYMTCFACVIGGAFFLLAALFVERDRLQTALLMQGHADVDSRHVNDAAVVTDRSRDNEAFTNHA